MTNSEEPPGSKPFGPTVFISNLSEDVWPFIENISDSKARESEIEENKYLSDRDLFSLASEERIVFITPKPVSGDFLTYYKDLFGKKQIEVLIPQSHSGKICEDILKDAQIMQALTDIANSHRRLTMIAYSTTPYFLELVKTLRRKGLSIYTPESPEEEDAWTVNFFGSKSGIRQLAQMGRVEEPDLIMADGIICSGLVDAAKIAAKKYLKEGGVVIKTNKGHSGLGIIIVRPGDLPQDYELAKEKILNLLQKDAYWEKFPIVIESYVQAGSSVGGGFPNVEFKITKGGKIELLYFCGMRVSKEGVFRGVEINDDVINDRIEAQITDTGFFIGEQFSQNGYRGYYDVDFVYSKSGKLFVTESNVRRTGGTHVFHIAEELIGKDFMYDAYILSCNTYPLPRKYTFPELYKILEPLLFTKKIKEGIVIVSENLLLQNKLAYVIIGSSKKRAQEIESHMENLLR